MFKRENLVWVCIVMMAAGAVAQTPNVTTAGGSAGTISVFTTGTDIESSVITQASGNVGIGLGTTAPALTLDVNGTARIGVAPADPITRASLTLGIDPTGFAGLNISDSNYNGAESIYFTNTGTYTAPNGTATAGTQYFITAGGPDVSGTNGLGVHENTLAFANRTTGRYSFVMAPNGSVGIGGTITHSNLSGAGMVILGANGNVGIGTITPGSALEVNGNVKLTSGSAASITFPDGTVQNSAYTGVPCGGDYAESVDVTGDRTNYEPGDVLVIDPTAPGKFLKANEAYTTLVAGIYSTKPGVVGRRQTTDPKTSTTEVPMAMVGIVPTKVSTENGPIKIGDLLVTSSSVGRAMRGTDRSLLTGAVIGKALGSLDSGSGVIEVLVTLQ
jgi:hypothetical protein